MVDMLPAEKHGFYVEFELRPAENRAESVKTGHPVFDDIEIAVITMPGGSLGVDKVVNEALLTEWKHGIPGRKPPSPSAIASYDAWKDGREAPVNGIDLKNWPGVTPAQLKMCQGANIRTVEDLADANADAIRRLGMGGVALRNKAISYMESAVTNKNSEEVASLKVEMEALKESLAKRDAQIQALMDQMGENEAPAKRGRPRKAA
jgi:hypothetical protein|tara:strand:- start:495 stop:1112 length:618 start_codon:yes stop_codon:yes gene_type:complete